MQLGIFFFFPSGKTVRVLLWYVAKGFRFWKVFLFLNNISQVPDTKRTIALPTKPPARPDPH